MAHSTANRLFLLDGMALAYRAHFAFISRPIRTSQGVTTSALFGFANTLIELIKNEKPTHLAVVFDTAAPTARHREFPAYKAQREEMPEDLSFALPYIRKFCAAFNVPVLSLDGYEADDIIGTLAHQADARGDFTTFMVTPDKDFAQLVSERSLIYKPGRQGSEHEILDLAKIKETWQVERPSQVIDILGLWGDASDNIPGVPGFGEKTAKALIAEFGSIEQMIARIDEMKGKQKEKFAEHKDAALLSKRLATIQIDVPLTVSLDDLAIRPMNEDAVKALLVEVEFNQLGRRLFGNDFQAGRGFQTATEPETQTLGDVGAPPAYPKFASLKTLADVPHTYAEASPEILTGLAAASVGFAVDLDAADFKTARLLGVAISWQSGEAHYISCVDGKLPAALDAFLRREDVVKIGYNLKDDANALLWNGADFAGHWHDVMIAQLLIDPEQKFGFTFLCESLLGYTPGRGATQAPVREGGELFLLETESESAARRERAMERADLSRQLMEKLQPRLAEAGVDKVFYQIESPLLPVLARMEHCGIKIDPLVLRDTGILLEKQIHTLEGETYALAGGPLNLNSPKQLGHVLFEKLKLVEKPKKTKTGQYVTNEEVLEELAADHPIARKILEYREASKLKSTYVDALPLAISPRSGRVHTHFHQVMTATGRLASSHPNLQNIPIRTEQGRDIRRAFIPGKPGWQLLSADYSQIELRIVAELSGDPSMLEAFAIGADIHAATAAKVYGLELAQITPNLRRNAKMVNFGIIYGISGFGLAQRLGISRSEGNRLIDDYFEKYPRIKAFMDETIAAAKSAGYVETLTGRRRYVREIRSANATVRKAAERTAINTPIQGTAADLIKIAMIRISRRLCLEGFSAKMLLQVHDELLFEFPPEEHTQLEAMVRTEMRHALPLKVPIIVEVGVGVNWKEAH